MKKSVFAIISLILIFGLSACNPQESDPIKYNRNPDEPIEVVGNEIPVILNSVFQYFISNSEIERISYRIEDSTIATIEDRDELKALIGLKNGVTSLIINYDDFNLRIEVIVSGIDEEIIQEQFDIPVFNFGAADNSGVNSFVVSISNSDTLVNVFHNGFFESTMNSDTSFTVKLPGTYTFEYEDEQGELVQYIPYIIEAPEINLSPNKSITFSSTPDYLRGRINGGPLEIADRIQNTAFGNYQIEIYFIDYQGNEQILEEYKFTIEPDINVNLVENELLEVQRPLNIQIINEIEEIMVNDNPVTLNAQREFIIRQTGLNIIEIKGLGGETRIFSVIYTNEIINDFNRYWFVILPVTFISIATISLKLIKGMRK